MTIATGPERGGDVETAGAVVHVEVVGNGMAVLIHALGAVVETEAIALCLLQRDAHHGLGGGGIAGTWILDDVDVLNLVGAKAREFLLVMHPPAVDVHLGIAAAQHLDGTVALSLERGNLRQGIAHRSGFLENRSGHGGAHGIALGVSLGQLTFHHHLAQRLRLFFHADGKAVGGFQVLGFVTYAAHLEQSLVGAGRDLEMSLLVGYCSLNEGGVGQRQQYHVYECHGLSVLVGHPTAHVVRLSHCVQAHHHSCKECSQSHACSFHIVYWGLVFLLH